MSDETKIPCENEWACNKSTLLWQRIHCKCLIEEEARRQSEHEQDAYDAYIDRRMGWDR